MLFPKYAESKEWDRLKRIYDKIDILRDDLESRDGKSRLAVKRELEKLNNDAAKMQERLRSIV